MLHATVAFLPFPVIAPAVEGEIFQVYVVACDTPTVLNDDDVVLQAAEDPVGAGNATLAVFTVIVSASDAAEVPHVFSAFTVKLADPVKDADHALLTEVVVPVKVAADDGDILQLYLVAPDTLLMVYVMVCAP